MKYEINATMYFDATLTVFAYNEDDAINHVKTSNVSFDIIDYIDNKPYSIDINVQTIEYKYDDINIISIEVDEDTKNEITFKNIYKVKINPHFDGKFTVYADSLSIALDYLKNAELTIKVIKYKMIDSHIRTYDVILTDGKYYDIEPSSAKEVLESE